MSVAFCFLLTNKFIHKDIWSEFFAGHEEKYTIISHIKNSKPDLTSVIPSWVSDHKIKTILTEWCDVSLVTAFANMVAKGLKNKNNKFFVLLSGDCIPLYDFDTVYETLFREKRSRLDIYYKNNMTYNSQWMVLNRDTAKVFKNIPRYYDYLEKYDDHRHCPDEIYPVLFFISQFGPVGSPNFEKYIQNKIMTYVKWPNTEKPTLHPMKMNKHNVDVREICNSKALFARKFFKSAAKKVAMKC